MRKPNRLYLIYFLLLSLSSLFLACNGLSSKQQTASDEAISALKKIEAATQVGVNASKYNDLLIEAKTKVNEALKVLPDGDLKVDISLAMFEYEEAGRDLRRYGADIASDSINMSWNNAREALERISSEPSEEKNKRRQTMKRVKEVIQNQ